MYNIALVLDQGLCPDPPWKAAESSSSKLIACRKHLELTFWPWFAFLPAFALSTLLLKNRLAVALHEAWYQPPRDPQVVVVQRVPPDVLNLDPPATMFKITGTFYSRTLDQIDEGMLSSVHNQHANHGQREGTMSPSSSLSRPAVCDPSSSILSARGTTFTTIVESEQLCFICYSDPPEAVLLECGHAGMCIGCATHLYDNPRRMRQPLCPICRQQVSMVLKLRPDLPSPTPTVQLHVEAEDRSRQTSDATSSSPLRSPAGTVVEVVRRTRRRSGGWFQTPLLA